MGDVNTNQPPRQDSSLWPNLPSWDEFKNQAAETVDEARDQMASGVEQVAESVRSTFAASHETLNAAREVVGETDSSVVSALWRFAAPALQHSVRQLAVATIGLPTTLLIQKGASVLADEETQEVVRASCQRAADVMYQQAASVGEMIAETYDGYQQEGLRALPGIGSVYEAVTDYWYGSDDTSEIPTTKHCEKSQFKPSCDLLKNSASYFVDAKASITQTTVDAEIVDPVESLLEPAVLSEFYIPSFFVSESETEKSNLSVSPAVVDKPVEKEATHLRLVVTNDPQELDSNTSQEMLVASLQSVLLVEESSVSDEGLSNADSKAGHSFENFTVMRADGAVTDLLENDSVATPGPSDESIVANSQITMAAHLELVDAGDQSVQHGVVPVMLADAASSHERDTLASHVVENARGIANPEVMLFHETAPELIQDEFAVVDVLSQLARHQSDCLVWSGVQFSHSLESHHVSPQMSALPQMPQVFIHAGMLQVFTKGQHAQTQEGLLRLILADHVHRTLFTASSKSESGFGQGSQGQSDFLADLFTSEEKEKKSERSEPVQDKSDTQWTPISRDVMV